MDYYLHKNVGWYDNYFGRVGEPFKVSYLRWIIYKAFGYRATRAPSGTSKTNVIVQAAIAGGAHPTSWRVDMIRKHGHDLKS